MVCAFVEIMTIEKKGKKKKIINKLIVNLKLNNSNYNNTLIISIVRGKGGRSRVSC